MEFEPLEIAAKSSEMSVCFDQDVSDSPQMSFQTMSSELKAQFDDEEFQSGNSKLIDELENKLSFGCMQTLSESSKNDQQKSLDFSGIMSELNLTDM